MELNAHEMNLIRFIRALEFDDILDAVEEIGNKSNAALRKALNQATDGNMEQVRSWQVRSSNLKELAERLGQSNEDYRNHTNDAFIQFDIKATNGTMADRFEELASLIREGWDIERIEDNVGNDGHYYFTLVPRED